MPSQPPQSEDDVYSFEELLTKLIEVHMHLVLRRRGIAPEHCDSLVEEIQKRGLHCALAQRPDSPNRRQESAALERLCAEYATWNTSPHFVLLAQVPVQLWNPSLLHYDEPSPALYVGPSSLRGVTMVIRHRMHIGAIERPAIPVTLLAKAPTFLFTAQDVRNWCTPSQIGEARLLDQAIYLGEADLHFLDECTQLVQRFVGQVGAGYPELA